MNEQLQRIQRSARAIDRTARAKIDGLIDAYMLGSINEHEAINRISTYVTQHAEDRRKQKEKLLDACRDMLVSTGKDEPELVAPPEPVELERIK